jgi:hypothetical protein
MLRTLAMSAPTAILCCELCETPMTDQSAKRSSVRYHHCSGCGRWVASTYRDSLVRAGTARLERVSAGGDGRPDFERIKSRMARWMESLEERDPYRVLGVPPSAPEDTVRARFKELALVNHPDRGGDPVAMRRVLDAWDRIRRSRRLAAS